MHYDAGADKAVGVVFFLLSFIYPVLHFNFNEYKTSVNIVIHTDY